MSRVYHLYGHKQKLQTEPAVPGTERGLASISTMKRRPKPLGLSLGLSYGNEWPGGKRVV